MDCYEWRYPSFRDFFAGRCDRIVGGVICRCFYAKSSATPRTRSKSFATFRCERGRELIDLDDDDGAAANMSETLGLGAGFRFKKTTISNSTQVTGASLANPDAALEIVLETNQAAGTLTIRCVGWRATSQQSHPRPKVLVATAHSKAPHAALLKLNSPRLAFFCVANLSSLSLFHSRTRAVVVVAATRAWA